MLKLDWNLLFTIINLLILYFALKKFLFAPVCKIIDEREAKIKSELENADKAKEEAEKLKTDYEAELANAQKQIVEITKKASEQAEKVGEAIIENARKESAEIIESAQKQALAEKDKAFDEDGNILDNSVLTFRSAYIGKYFADKYEVIVRKGMQYNMIVNKNGLTDFGTFTFSKARGEIIFEE